MIPATAFRKSLLHWYERNRRDLPWRRTRDPWAILVSEVMLQQTRVETVIPYFERFMQRFPHPAALAEAPEQEVLTMWAGLGYYRRARNLHAAARAWDAPVTYDALRALKGVGDYTAAAVASIAFDLPYAVVDGNVKRVIARLTNGAGEPWSIAGSLLSRKRPGDFNQALMELGATLCVPRDPRCGECPVVRHCEGRRQGRERELPVAGARADKIREEKTLLILLRNGELLLRQRPADSTRLASFWELPEQAAIPEAGPAEKIGYFRHTIVNHEYAFTVQMANAQEHVEGTWWPLHKLNEIPLSTTAKKAVLCLYKTGLNQQGAQ